MHLFVTGTYMKTFAFSYTLRNIQKMRYSQQMPPPLPETCLIQTQWMKIKLQEHFTTDYVICCCGNTIFLLSILNANAFQKAHQ